MSEFDFLPGVPGNVTLDDLQASTEAKPSLMPDFDAYVARRLSMDQTPEQSDLDNIKTSLQRPLAFATREDAEKALEQARANYLRDLPVNEPVTRKPLSAALGELPKPVAMRSPEKAIQPASGALKVAGSRLH